MKWKKICACTAMAVLALGLAACGSSGGGGGTSGGLNNARSVTGTCRSANGDPLPGVTVYLPGTTVSASVLKATRSFNKVVMASDGTTCEDPTVADNSLAAGCSAQDGSVTIDTSSLTTNPTQIVFQRGALRMVQNLNCTADPCALDSSVTTFGGGTTTYPRVAVVTGAYDRMEDVLAKLADTNTSDSTNGSYGRVDSTTGIFVYGSEYGTRLTIISGTGFTTPDENQAQIGSYTTWDKYLDGTNPLVSSGAPVFDVIFIDCGTNYDTAINLTATAIGRLQEYVNAGGRLYVTDLSYDFVEQPFPQVMQFAGDPADSSTPGAFNAAELGHAGLVVNAAVNDTGLLSWLKNVTVNQHDASTPGNPETPPEGDCSGTYTQRTGAVTSGNLIPIDDFLGGWAQMVGAHAGQSPTIWISSGAGTVFDGLDNRPLTASMDIGSNGGRVIYSSYHTAHSCPTIYFWSQERVLQNLIFGAF